MVPGDIALIALGSTPLLRLARSRGVSAAGMAAHLMHDSRQHGSKPGCASQERTTHGRRGSASPLRPVQHTTARRAHEVLAFRVRSSRYIAVRAS